MLNIAVLVSGGGTNLQALLDAAAAGAIKNGKIAVVLSSKPGVYALERAQAAHVPAVVVERKKYKSIEDFSRSVEGALEAFKPDLLVLAGFLSIFDGAFCQRYENRIINIHPALIPSFCGKGMYGLHVHEAALAAGVKVTGATVHFVNEKPDGGPIILQKAVEILDGDTPESLQLRVMEQAEHVLLPHAVSLFCQGKIKTEGNITHILL